MMSYKNYNDDYLKWANEEVKVGDKHSMMTKTVITNEDGSKTTVLQKMNFHSTNERIDGHFWIEDMTGKIVSDCGFSKYQHNLPCFADPDYYNPDTDFVVYQPVPNLEMENRIIEECLKLKVESWGKDTTSKFGFTDKRSQYERFQDKAKQIWENRDTMLSTGFDCVQNAFCEWVVRGEENCRIRFGCAGKVRPKADEVFWFFGHLDNTKYGEWIVKDAVHDDGKEKTELVHSRKMKIREVPNAQKVMKEREFKRKVFAAYKALKKKKEIEAKQAIADKAYAELMAMEDEPKETKKKKKKTKQIRRT